MASSSRRTARPRFTLVILILASVTIITLGYKGGTNGWVSGAKGVAADAFAPVQSAANSVFRPIGNFFAGAARYGSVKSENARLRQEIAALRAQSALASSYHRQAIALEAQDHLAFAGTLHQVVTQVAAGSPSNFQGTIELDKGTDAGIKVGMPAVSGTGLLGRVVSVSRLRATVLLITDPSSQVGVRFGDRGHLAVAVGEGKGRLLAVLDVAPGTRLVRHELMVTSGGQGDLYPAGIPVGTVVSASDSPGALQEAVSLTPFVNLGTEQVVSVLLWIPARGAMP